MIGKEEVQRGRYAGEEDSLTLSQLDDGFFGKAEEPSPRMMAHG